MIRKIIYTNADGTMAVVHPARNSRGDEALTDQEIEQRAWSKLPAAAITPALVNPSLIPSDRTFRNAWRQDGNSVRIDPVVREAIAASPRMTLAEELAALKRRLATLEAK
jgi:hypothetical protein